MSRLRFTTRLLPLLLSIICIGLPLQLWRGRSLMGALGIGLLAFGLLRMGRRILISSATAALANGKNTKSKRLYWLLEKTSLHASDRIACKLSQLACDAAKQKYEEVVSKLAFPIPSEAFALHAVQSNLHAYCLARLGKDLAQALSLSEASLEMRPHVTGFQHTRGLILLELGRLNEAIAQLDKIQGFMSSKLFESERCYDIGRLWILKGQRDYANDYFIRSLRVSEGAWAQKSRGLAQSKKLTSLQNF